VEEVVMAELGVRISKAFSRFDVEPVAAASLGQVHRAALRDGRAVVVKVQRPNIRQQIAEDFEVLEQIAGFLDGHTALGRRHRFLVILQEFRLTIQQELNYEREAHNLIALGKNLKEFKLIQVPQPVPDYCTRSVLTMEEVQGQKITALGPLALLDLKGAPLAEELFKAYLQQVLVDGLFHADPHPGNVFVTNDGRIALIDLGMVGHTAPAMQENLLKILLAISEGNGEAAAEIAIRMSEKLEEFAAPEFRRRITQLVALRRDQGLEQLNVGRSLLEVSGIAQENGLIVPSELVLLGKTMLQLDEVGRILDPTFDTNASIRRNVAALMARRMRKDLTQGSIYSTLLEMKDFTDGTAFPAQPDHGRGHQLRAGGEGEGHRRQDGDGRHAEDREPHHHGHRAGRPDRRRVTADARGDPFPALRLSRAGHPLLPRGRGRGLLARDQHLCLGLPEPEKYRAEWPSRAPHDVQCRQRRSRQPGRPGLGQQTDRPLWQGAGPEESTPAARRWKSPACWTASHAHHHQD
jgi:hypothetical protein